MGRTARLHAGAGQLQRAVQHRQRRAIEDEARTGAARHLQAVSQQAEARHIGGGHDPLAHQDLRRDPVETAHLVDGGLQIRVRRLALPRARDEDPGPESFRQQEPIAGSCATLAQELVGVRRADHRETVLGLGVADRVAAGKGATGFADRGRRALEDRGEHVPWQILGERRDRQGEQDATAHREHVAEGVRGCDLAERARVVDERREEVERADDREVIRDAVGGGIVGRVQAGDERPIGVDGGFRAKAAQGIGKKVRTEFRGTPAAIGQVREAERARRRGLERRHAQMIRVRGAASDIRARPRHRAGVHIHPVDDARERSPPSATD